MLKHNSEYMNKIINVTVTAVVILAFLFATACNAPPQTDAVFETPEAAYLHKYQELVSAHGQATVKAGPGESGMSRSWLGGVCGVELLDFDGDGNEELLVIYSTDDATALPQAGTYQLEVWTYSGGELSLLVQESTLGTCSASRWIPGDIFVTVFVNYKFLPAIQLCNETESGCAYTNIYYDEGELIRDEFVQEGESFYLNGLPLEADAFASRVDGEGKVLHGFVLACSDYTSAYLQLLSRNELIPALERVAAVSNALAGGEPSEKAEFEPFGAAKGFFTLCVDEIMHSAMPPVPQWINWYDYLYDMNQDGIPEVIVCHSDEAHLFTFSGGQMVYAGQLGVRASMLYTSGDSDIIAYWGHMGYYEMTLITMDGAELKQEVILEGYIDEGDYPTPEDAGRYNYTELFDFIQGNAVWNKQWYASELYLTNGNAILG